MDLTCGKLLRGHRLASLPPNLSAASRSQTITASPTLRRTRLDSPTKTRFVCPTTSADAGSKFSVSTSRRGAICHASTDKSQQSGLLGFLGGKSEVTDPDSELNGHALAEEEQTYEETIHQLQALLAKAEEEAQVAKREKELALETARSAEAEVKNLEAAMVATTEAAMAEVEVAKAKFKAELERLEAEKADVESQLVMAQQEGIDLAIKVERMAAVAVQEQTQAVAEEAKVKIAAANAEAADLAAQMEEKIRLAADEAAAAVIEEAKATIEDAIAAADIAKEQAKAAEAALQEGLAMVDKVADKEIALLQAEEARAGLQLKLEQSEAEKETLRMEIKAAIARAEAAEARITITQAAVAEIQAHAERTAKERQEATERALDAMRTAAQGREKAATLTFKAETESLRAAADAAQKAESVKEQAISRRFSALQKSLSAAEEATKKWKERCLAVEDLLSMIQEKGFSVLREAGEYDDLLNRGRMDIMLDNESEKWKILAEGPRRDRPDWLARKTLHVTPLPSLPLDQPLEVVNAAVPVQLPKPEEVWSIATHKLADDVFTKEAAAREAESKEIEEKRQELEQMLTRKAAKRVRTPDDLEDIKESGTGTGREVVMQAFNWESNKRDWYMELAPRAADLAACGITALWLPPPTESVSPQGYMPVDLYNLNSSYGTQQELQYCIEEFHKYDLLVLGDVVLNHRCASKQSKEGIWNIFGGKLAWGPEAIVRDDPNFHGKGNPSSGDFFHAAPNVDHSQEFVRADIKQWLVWLREEIGYDGWRLDFARGFWGGYVKEYIEASNPAFCIGEYWDSLAYEGGTPAYNQNAHRQRIINWINATGGTSSAFDVTTKGILHSALHNEYWRLIDPQGKPPGVMGWWPSRAVTFLENHDTGSTQAHWPFPREKLMQGYAYILTHPGTPVIFYDHFYDFGLKDRISELIAARKHCGIHCRSPVKIFHANAQGYVAMVGDSLVMKMGHFDWNPSRQNELMGRWEKFIDKGGDYMLWEKV